MILELVTECRDEQSWQNRWRKRFLVNCNKYKHKMHRHFGENLERSMWIVQRFGIMERKVKRRAMPIRVHRGEYIEFSTSINHSLMLLFFGLDMCRGILDRGKNSLASDIFISEHITTNHWKNWSSNFFCMTVSHVIFFLFCFWVLVYTQYYSSTISDLGFGGYHHGAQGTIQYLGLNLYFLHLKHILHPSPTLILLT